jgi:hypothetical protein
VEDFCGHGDGSSGSIKCEEFLDQMSDYSFPRITEIDRVG